MPVYCGAPWVAVNIDAEGRVNPCCHTAKYGQFGNIKTQDLASIWNGEAYVALRKALASGNLRGSGCEGCRSRQYADFSRQYDMPPVTFKDVPQNHSEIYLKNQATLQNHLERGDSRLESMPTSLTYSPSHACNIACVFCAQKPNKKAACGPRGYEALLQVLPYLNDIMWIGGEPMVQKEFYDWLDRDAATGNPGTKVFIITNCASLPDRVVAKLAAFQYCHVSVSLDACDKALYESLRRKAVWENTYANLKKLLDLREKHSGFGVMVSYLLQKDNLDHLPDFIDFCKKHHLVMRVDPLYTYPIPMRIDLYPELTQEQHEQHLDVVHRSVAKMQELYALLCAAPEKNPLGIPGFGCVHDALKRYEDGARNVFAHTDTVSGDIPEGASKLLVAYQGNTAVSYAFAEADGHFSLRVPKGLISYMCYDDMFSCEGKFFNPGKAYTEPKDIVAGHAGQRIAVWGTGGHFREHIASLPGFEDNADIRYLIDSDPRKQGGLIANKPVYGPEKLRDGDVDVLIIASTFKFEIYQTLSELVPDMAFTVY